MDFWSQLGLVALAVALGVLVGAEREYQGKAAGMRTHGLIAMGAALFVLAGRWGFDLAVGTPASTQPGSRRRSWPVSASSARA
ncbi:hypothetical protein GCM10029992_66790 [Glycomyces albus]